MNGGCKKKKGCGTRKDGERNEKCRGGFEERAKVGFEDGDGLY